MVEELVFVVKVWIKEEFKVNFDGVGVQLWDKKGYKMFGGILLLLGLVVILLLFLLNLCKQFKGVLMLVLWVILVVVVEGVQVDFDIVSCIESCYFVLLVIGQVVKNMMQVFFFDLQVINVGGFWFEGIGKILIKRIGVLGVGMMGVGIVYVFVKVGYEVVFKDVSFEVVVKGKGYFEKLEVKVLEWGCIIQECSDVLLVCIILIVDVVDFKGVDFVIEVVFENQEFKYKVFGEIEDIVEFNVILGFNILMLLIIGLVIGVKWQEDFIGIYFFLLVDKMLLVEIIKGEKIFDEVLVWVFDYILVIGKILIVVNDSCGFFILWVIGMFVNEVLVMFGEGVELVFIEQVGLQVGYLVLLLQLFDEFNLELMYKIVVVICKGVEDVGGMYQLYLVEVVVEKMIEFGWFGWLKGVGFYEYVDGK